MSVFNHCCVWAVAYMSFDDVCGIIALSMLLHCASLSLA